MAEPIGIVQKIGELGQIFLPPNILKRIGINEGDVIELFMDEKNNSILLRKSIKVCKYCQATENLEEILAGFYLCKSCMEKLK